MDEKGFEELKERFATMKDVAIGAPTAGPKVRTDAWKTSGKCSECRREKYCGSICTAHKKALKALAKKTVEEKT